VKSSSVVRTAGPEDYDEIWRLFRLLWEENGLFAICETKVDYYIKRLLSPDTITPDDTGPRGFIGVIGPVGALEGCIMMTIGSYWYTEDWTLDELLNFVDPAHRSSDHAKALIRFAKDCADKISVRLVIGIMSTKRTAAKMRLYDRQLTQCGGFYMYPPPDGVSPPHRPHKAN
jgi:GNAT superfamily N-acetyltransferase